MKDQELRKAIINAGVIGEDSQKRLYPVHSRESREYYAEEFSKMQAKINLILEHLGVKYAEVDGPFGDEPTLIEAE